MSKIILPGAVLALLPLGGVYFAGLPISRYLEFPPYTRYIEHAPFSWPVFTGYGLFVACALTILFWAGLRPRKTGEIQTDGYPFAWWGYAGIIFGLAFWALAWTRFSWFESFQAHTFTPLWLSFILVVNALTLRRQGRCIMLNRPLFFLSLFPSSAVFWWFFEYLNRFVQNWHYTGVRFSPGEYFSYATLCFSTVLPAFISVHDWINGHGWFRKRFTRYPQATLFSSKITGAVALPAAATGLALIGIWPDYLFSLLWVAPLLIIFSLQTLRGKPPAIFGATAKGNWQPLVSAALAALFCGGFWEMWNFFSLARWEYSLPHVHRLMIFEMPLLGYAGYLPFGLECMLVIELIEDLTRRP